MIVKLLTEHHLEFLNLKKAAQARLSLHLSKCHTDGNHMSRLKYLLIDLEIYGNTSKTYLCKLCSFANLNLWFE